ncbi:MAG: hypothetical protein ABI610_12300 [Acidobacteriota bacterium]
MKTWKKVVLGLVAVVVPAAAFFVWKIGAANVIGMLRYDQREEGTLLVGHAAPDVSLVALDGRTRVSLASSIGEKPLVLVFGSYT